MALMARSKLKGKGPAHKSKSFKKKQNAKLAAKSTASKRSSKKRRNVDVTMIDTDIVRGASAIHPPPPPRPGIWPQGLMGSRQLLGPRR